jgi:hypothetical protein
VKRKHIALVASIGVIALGIPVILMATGRTRINQENFKLITKGMSKTDVSQILGPPGAYGGGSQTIIDSIGDPLDPAVYLQAGHENWHNGRNSIQLYYDEDGKVIAGSFAVIVDEVVDRSWFVRLMQAVGF